jgi:hypothetical protein
VLIRHKACFIGSKISSFWVEKSPSIPVRLLLFLLLLPRFPLHTREAIISPPSLYTITAKSMYYDRFNGSMKLGHSRNVFRIEAQRRHSFRRNEQNYYYHYYFTSSSCLPTTLATTDYHGSYFIHSVARNDLQVTGVCFEYPNYQPELGRVQERKADEEKGARDTRNNTKKKRQKKFKVQGKGG